MTTQINIRIDDKLKKDTEVIFEKLGISVADAFRIFLKKVQLENGIPFSLKVEKEVCWDDLKDEVKNDIINNEKYYKDFPSFDSTHKLFDSLGISNNK